MIEIKLVINFHASKVISVNSMYEYVRYRVILSKEYRALSQRLKSKLPDLSDVMVIINELKSNESFKSYLEIHWITKVFYKNGKVRKKDVSNIIKPIEDILESWVGFDDKMNVGVQAVKFNHDLDYDILKIRLRVIPTDKIDYIYREYEVNV